MVKNTSLPSGFKTKEEYAKYMRDYRKRKKDEPMKAYWAGIIDGEGTINIAKALRASERSKSPNHQIRLTMTNTDESLVQEMKKFFKVGNVCNAKTPIGSKEAYKYYTSNSDALSVIRQVLPYLITKKKQAMLAIDFDNSRTKLCQKGIPKQERKVPEIELQLREGFYRRMQILNHRGSP